jgi:hypothetical protein
VSVFKRERKISYIPTQDVSVMALRFEDLVLHNESTLEKIYYFLNVDASVHSEKGKYFKPHESAVNIDSWKKVLSKDEIMTIERELSDYCDE